MERLTYWNEEYGCWSYHGPSGEAAKRLAAYEDTGLEPEEIFSAVDMAKIACALHELNVYKELGSIDCLRKLAGGPGETSTTVSYTHLPARGQAEYQRRLRNRGRWRRDKEEHHGAEAET